MLKPYSASILSEITQALSEQQANRLYASAKSKSRELITALKDHTWREALSIMYAAHAVIQDLREEAVYEGQVRLSPSHRQNLVIVYAICSFCPNGVRIGDRMLTNNPNRWFPAKTDVELPRAPKRRGRLKIKVKKRAVKSSKVRLKLR